MKFPVRYKNGNYNVIIESDGTKIRLTKDDEFISSRPETLDINISNYCENNCPWCYINATKDGKHGNLGLKFFDTIPSYTEIAINYALHPGLEDFLHKMKGQRVITNITINEKDLLRDWPRILDWQNKGLLYGVGVSINSKDNDTKWIVDDLENVVAHTIYGITTLEDYEWISESFDKVLVLGYKSKGRGKEITPVDQINITKIYNLFKIVSFDNTGIEQSGIKNNVSDDEWECSFLGDEGVSSFYIDTIQEKFYKSSTEEYGFKIGDKSIIEMFKEIRA